MNLRDHDFYLSYGPADDRLHAFYIPALSASVRYDRMTGYFTSGALAVAAAGVARLIAGGGRMRMLVGAQLSREDVQAIAAGHDLQTVVAASLGRALPDPADLEDQLLRDRLATLAWMVAAGALEMRVVLPTGPDGLPLPAPESQDYFHPKVGIFSDADGHQIAFSGSVNESVTGWQHNYEQFMVFTSWSDGRAWVAEAVSRFERLWGQREPDWLALPVPEAARQKLLRYTPSRAPARDPLERDAEKGTVALKEEIERLVLAPAVERERVLCQFLRDAPHLVDGAGLGGATAAVEPWPHQQSVARQVVETYPARYLFCDEVGLGKTIEAGLVLRALWLRGIVRRGLILAPKSVLRQWQEELYEKFVLDVPLYDGKGFTNYWGVTHIPSTPDPWADVTLALASSQLMKRQERQAELLETRPWDLILVDEAHHARRKDFLDRQTYRPNRLLELLNRLQGRTKGLLLLTATPMQVDPIEVWDLLNLLGLSGEWGADGRHFLRFYAELRSAEPDWPFVLQMFHAERAVRGEPLDGAWAKRARQHLGAVAWTQLQQLLENLQAGGQFRQLPPEAQALALDRMQQVTPLRRLVFRNTRALLRDYRRRGLLQENVPTRLPRLEWVPMRPEERALYDRIEEYISASYRKYEEQRKGLGFVMTVYRRRLTSSFYAVRCSLERRLAFLQGRAGLGLDEDDLEQETLALDVDEERLDERAADYRDEIAYVEDFLRQLSALGGHDSKVRQLLDDIDDAFRQRETVLVFTQYTDTLDFLREQLRQQYGPQVACYSGRGGERWDGVLWAPVTKEELKNDFRRGEVKVLLATEAASEGLNLQTCGVLINYDMPWNPMRVEQRIGRVDRIGQRYDEVWIRNYFYAETVEARVYQALSERIDWFQVVVGPLQPILAQVERAIQRVALSGGEERRRLLQRELDDLNTALDGRDEQLDLDAWSAQARDGGEWPAPLTLPELAATVTECPTLWACFRPHPSIGGAFWLRLGGEETAVTFDRAVFDIYPNSLRLLTYGNPLLERLLASIAALEGDVFQGALLRVAVTAPWPRVGYYILTEAGQVQRLASLEQVRAALDAPDAPVWTATQIEAAQADLEAAATAEWARSDEGRERLVRAQREALLARAGRLLLDAALVELALGQQPAMFGETGYPLAFAESAVTGLRRHGYPWTALLGQVTTHAGLTAPQPTDPFFVAIQGQSAEQLRRQFERLARQAQQLLAQLAALG
ncbi:MAG TPA: helicase [Chloroflexi bacterium]|nr:helicase [Chloroflexota bacterium]